MKQLETSYKTETHSLTQVKRNDKAVIYKRESLNGQFSSFDVFAIRSKNDEEIYPNDTAEGIWLFQPTSETRANIWFDRFTNGDIVIPDTDPVTGEAMSSDERSLDELPDVTVSTNTIEPENPLNFDTVSSEPFVQSVDVTPSENVVVTVAKVKKNVVMTNLVIPSGEFTQADFARANSLPERGVVWSRLDNLVKDGKLNKMLKVVGKGRPKQFFTEKV